MTPPAALRVLIVDDSAFMRASLKHIVGRTPGFAVAGESCDGLAAVEAIHALRPDIVTLDIDMPGLDGIGVLKRIRPTPGVAPAVIMVSAFTTQGAGMTLAALDCGAIDFVPKASEHFRNDLAQVGDLLRAKLAVAAAALRGRGPGRPPAATPAPPPTAMSAPPPPGASARRPFVAASASAPDLVVVAASTGGPQTLPALLRPLRAFPAPIVIAQHIPPLFSRSLADSLAAALGIPVVEAEEGKPLAPGTVHLLPGGRNAELTRPRAGQFALRTVADDGSEAAAVHRPNADILFRSAALTARRPVGVVLTGMGSDGTEGARALARRGCPVLVQDPAGAVIWGMPTAVIEAGLATEVLDPAALGQRLAVLAGGTA